VDADLSAMTPMPRTTKRRWAAAGAGALGIGVLGVMLFRGPEAPLASTAPLGAKRSVTLVSGEDKAVNDESILLDPTPLFLPTKWNSTQRDFAPREPGGRFQGFDTPKFTFAENDLKLVLPEAIKAPDHPANVVADEAPAAPLVGFGRTDVPVVAPQPRGGYVEITTAATGRNVLAQPIAAEPPGKGGWQPMEFIARVDAAGLVGPLVLTTRSGLEEVDSFFAKYLVRTLRVGERLAPGSYRIFVGP